MKHYQQNEEDRRSAALSELGHSVWRQQDHCKEIDLLLLADVLLLEGHQTANILKRAVKILFILNQQDFTHMPPL